MNNVAGDQALMYLVGTFGDLLRERDYRIARFEIDDMLLRFGNSELVFRTRIGGRRRQQAQRGFGAYS